MLGPLFTIESVLNFGQNVPVLYVSPKPPPPKPTPIVRPAHKAPLKGGLSKVQLQQLISKISDANTVQPAAMKILVENGSATVSTALEEINDESKSETQRLRAAKLVRTVSSHASKEQFLRLSKGIFAALENPDVPVNAKIELFQAFSMRSDINGNEEIGEKLTDLTVNQVNPILQKEAASTTFRFNDRKRTALLVDLSLDHQSPETFRKSIATGLHYGLSNAPFVSNFEISISQRNDLVMHALREGPLQNSYALAAFAACAETNDTRNLQKLLPLLKQVEIPENLRREMVDRVLNSTFAVSKEFKRTALDVCFAFLAPREGKEALQASSNYRSRIIQLSYLTDSEELYLLHNDTLFSKSERVFPVEERLAAFQVIGDQLRSDPGGVIPFGGFLVEVSELLRKGETPAPLVEGICNILADPNELMHVSKLTVDQRKILQAGIEDLLTTYVDRVREIKPQDVTGKDDASLARAQLLEATRAVIQLASSFRSPKMTQEFRRMQDSEDPQLRKEATRALNASRLRDTHRQNPGREPMKAPYVFDQAQRL